ncbi:hypothetical protein SESBI_13938 [Sesbania bispinosa]|nr:hypothetical protein SESBI_13938 [Sesbania bispinosa]
MEIVDVSKEEVGKALFAKKKMCTKGRDLTNLAKLLFNIVSKTLIPRDGSYEKLYPSDLLITFHLIIGRKINLPHIILSYMTHSIATNLQSSLVYPMLLTKVFEHFDVALLEKRFLINIGRTKIEAVVPSPQRTPIEENQEKEIENEKVIIEKEDQDKMEEEDGNRQ